MSSPPLVVVLGDPALEATRGTVAAFADDVNAGRCQVVAVEGVPDALAALGQTSFVILVASGDQPTPHAVVSIVEAIERCSDVDLLYGDEVRADAASDSAPSNSAASDSASESRAFHKPAWSPERLLSQNYLGSMVVYRASMLAGFDVSAMTGRTVEHQLHDLALQAVSAASVVIHLPDILCGSALRPLGSTSGAVREVQRHFDREKVPAGAVVTGRSWDDRPMIGFEPRLGERSPLVSIVMPTGGSTRTVRGQTLVLVDNAIRSLIDNSTYERIEIVVVVDAKSTQALLDQIADLDPRVRIVRDERPFNFAAACNLGVAASVGSLVVLLNDDTEVVTPDWIERLVVLTTIDDVGAVGVKLLYSDGRVQHGGVGTSVAGPDHLYHGYPGDDLGHGGWLAATVNCFAATGACLAVRRDHWDAVGGMDEVFPLNYNDIDLCLRLQAEGWRTVVDNQTELMHLETSSRPAGSEQWEVDAFRGRWESSFAANPYGNPNLVTVGLLQVPPPPELTELRRYRGKPPHSMRVWSRSRGFGLAVDEG